MSHHAHHAQGMGKTESVRAAALKWGAGYARLQCDGDVWGSIMSKFRVRAKQEVAQHRPRGVDREASA